MKTKVGYESISDVKEGVTREQANKNIKQVYDIIRDRPEEFNMSNWHCINFDGEKQCGTAHCLAGWAEVLYEQKTYCDNLKKRLNWCVDYAKGHTYKDDFTMRSNAKAAGRKHLWPISHLFYESNATALSKIREYLQKWDMLENEV